MARKDKSTAGKVDDLLNVWSHQKDSNVSNGGLFHASYIISRCKPCRISLENVDDSKEDDDHQGAGLESVELFQTLIGYIAGECVFIKNKTFHKTHI